MRFFRSFSFSVMFFRSILSAEIREIDQFDSLIQEVSDQKTIVFLDIDETLIEMPIMLGGKAWRHYASHVLEKTMTPEQAAQVQAKLSYFIAKRVPCVPIEKNAQACLKSLQEKNMSIFCLTARGKEHWHDMAAADSEELTVLHLKQGGFDFSSLNTVENDPIFSHPSYARGIFFAYPIEDKGDLILELFARTDLRPTKAVFVDDKRDNVSSVHNAFEKLKIPSVCFHYSHIDKYRTFDSLTAYIQLEKLFFEGRALSDAEAAAFKSAYMDKSPDEFFLEFLSCFEKAL